MGKRELLLIAVFGLVGLAVYQFTAPPARPGQEGFSIGRAWQHIRTEIQGEAALAENRSTTTGAVAAGIDELVLAETRGTITVLGEPRSDVLVEVRAEVSGSDQPEAERRARGMTAQVVPGGPSLRLTVPIPSGARRYRVDMTVHIPSRLGVRADGLRGQLNVRGAAAVKLNVRGDAVIKDIAGTVEGEHRGGDVEISGARAVRLETRGSDVRLES
ncbi:MAG: hypothetical protein HYX76_00230, partial [Acidobacteria bacterium]|nr:hypothetical protein [Acidobacteriota bacterium]